jgi:DNA invertase Pin-like site-specific DNA recombinase
MKTACAYVRVSTDDQNLGPEAQRRDIAAWCAANGYELGEVFEDRLSGATLPEDSPGLLSAFEYCEKNGVKSLVVSKRDRLARDKMRVALIEHHLEKCGVKILSASGEGNGDGPEDYLIRGIMDLFSEYERMVIKFRTKKALAVKRSRGEKLGGTVTYGFDVVFSDGVKRLVPNEREQSVITLAWALKQGGNHTLRQIKRELERLNIPTKTGGTEWSLATIRRMVA